jgi:protease inhibitor Inh
MRRGVPLAFALLLAGSAPLAAQAPATDAPAQPAEPEQPSEVVTEPAPPAAPRTMVGSWEFSNADREKICTITFQIGRRLEFDQACARHFPFIREIVGWSQAENDFLRLVDASGKSVLEFSEVESGIFEAPRVGEGILFIQNPAGLGPAPKSAEQIAGDWTLVLRTGKPICGLTLSKTAVGEEFAVRVQPPCDAVVARFAPATWSMDRGEVVLRSAGGQSWRFEEGEDAKWHRIPETANPILMVRK